MKNLNGQEAILALFAEAGNSEILFRQIETAAGPEDLVKLGLENGYEFRIGELQEFMKARSEEFFLGGEQEDYELSESELEVVAGGAGWCSFWSARAQMVSEVSNGKSNLCEF